MPARVNPANLYNALGPNQDAAREFLEAIERAPGERELQYSLGLLLAEEERLEDSLRALGEAVRVLPEHARVHYNYGLALQQLGRLEEAEAAMLNAHRLDSVDPDVLQALVAFYAQQRQRDHAYLSLCRTSRGPLP